ncbi:hypothetical protein EZV62_004013 [Acer yangbiense]|uniref:Bulb-type lectin domain-containing protein n=1 Tax=Acer yangbiense TaxID=1000413 RepID=A0A5C7IIW5_9ROSI|nr:hypothetical protein EZV62_004013 [Acer yangbiense]
MASKGRIDMLVRFSCMLVLLMGNSYSQKDKLLQGEELKDGDELLSTFGKFKLGFFTPSENPFSTTPSSSKRYIGVWYNKPEDRTSYQSSFYEVPYRKVVWVSNRNSPIIDKSGSLRVDSTDGNLKIFHSGGNPIAISSVEGARNTSVTLDQSGNLVLHELHSNGSINGMLWQSFDYPTHTLLPGMKLGINLQTGHQWFLRSWLTYYSPAEGSFTFGMDPNLTDRLIIRWFGEVQWTSGLWSNEEFKSWVDRGYNFSYISNEQEKYFSYSVKDDVISFPTLQVDQKGYLNDDSGFSMACSEEGRDCGPYTNSSAMSNRDSSYFVPKFGLMSSVDGTKFRESDNMTLYDCGLKCYQNCSCVAYTATNRENETGCEIWSRGTKFIKSHINDSRYIYFEVEPKVLRRNKKVGLVDMFNNCNSWSSSVDLVVFIELCSKEKIQRKRGEEVVITVHCSRSCFIGTSVMLLMLYSLEETQSRSAKDNELKEVITKESRPFEPFMFPTLDGAFLFPNRQVTPGPTTQRWGPGDELLSAFGKFNLGFFSPQDLTNSYFGVWYNRPKDAILMLYEEDNY